MKNPCDKCDGSTTSQCCDGGWDDDSERCYTCQEFSENQCSECEDIEEYKKYLENNK